MTDNKLNLLCDNSEIANWISTEVDFGYFYWNLSIHFNVC